MHAESADAGVVRRRRRRGLASLLDRDWLFALALACAVGVAVWFGRSVKDFFGPSAQSTLVPAFVGQTQSDMRSECARVGLHCVVLATQSSDRYPKDVVMSQQPRPGTRVRQGRQVSLVVSSGVTIFAMPDLRFESLRNASLDLNRLKLQLDKQGYVGNDDVPRDHVVAQDPPPLASVRQGSKVSLTLSKGPPSSIRVPNFSGKDVQQARALAAHDHVRLGQIIWTPFGPSGPRRGEIVRQKPGPGAQIDPFEEVSLQASAGPGEYGYLIRQTHVATSVPPHDDQARVRLTLHDETGTWNVYDGFAQGGQKLDFTVTSVGPAELDTYINNELLNQTVIGKEAPHPIPTAPPSGAAQVKKTP